MSRRGKGKPKMKWSPDALASAQRIYDINKGRVEAGETFRSYAPSGYRRSAKRRDGL